jgi:hypothetical protein
MAIYRPRRSPWPLALAMAVVALLIGFGIGFAVFGTRPPDLDAATEVIEGQLADARGLLEIVSIEYREGAPDGSIASQSEYAAAGQAADRARAAYDEVAGAVRTLAPERATAIEDGFDELDALIADVAPPDAVDDAAGALIASLSATGASPQAVMGTFMKVRISSQASADASAKSCALRSKNECGASA